MSAKTLCSVWDYKTSPESKFVMLAIADGCGDQFTIPDAVEVSSKKTGYTYDYVSNLVASLVFDGLIVDTMNAYYQLVFTETHESSPKSKYEKLRRNLTHLIPNLTFRDGGFTCHYCHSQLDYESTLRYPTIEHMTPVSRGGDNDIDNLCLACFSCNAQKGRKTHDEYIKWLSEVKSS